MTRIITMVALRTTDPVDWAAVADGMGADRSEIRPNEDGTVPTAITLSIPSGMIGMVHMPMPIPWGDLEWPVQAAWQWPAAEAELKAHRAHVVVFAGSDDLSVVDVHLRLTGAVASVVAACPDAVAVYNGNASIVVEPGEYVAQAREASGDSLPVQLWLGIHLGPGAAGLSAYTTGMEAFDLLNLEMHDSPWSPPELFNFLANIAHYEISANLQIGDGETVGSSQDERIRVRHLPSRYGDRAVSCHLMPGIEAV